MSARTQRTGLVVCSILGALAVLGVLAGPPKHPAQADRPTAYAPHVPGEILVRFKDTAHPAERAEARLRR
jgi:hypothetical protein